MSEKRYIVTEKQIFDGIRGALEISIKDQRIRSIIMDDIEMMVDFDYYEEYKESDTHETNS